MRHAKSDYPDGIADHERPLASRGIREAGLAGDWIREFAPPVDLVLCSTATRTRQTLRQTGIDAPAQFIDRLYGATPGAVIDEINKAPSSASTVLVVGHEPAMSATSLGLASPAEGDSAAVQRISMKFPTSAIAVLRIAGDWDALELGGAALSAFHIPR